VLLEARAFACPTIASAVGGIPSSITDGEDGLLVPPDDPKALEEAIWRIATNPELRLKIIAAGIGRARRSTVDAFASSIVEEAEQAVSAERARRQEWS